MMRRNKIAHRIAMKVLSDIAEVISPSEHLKGGKQSDAEHLIMQKDKVLHHFLDRPGEADNFEDHAEFDEVSYLVRYLIEEDGTKRKKDSF
jgi:hypothetical protein